MKWLDYGHDKERPDLETLRLTVNKQDMLCSLSRSLGTPLSVQETI